MPSDFESEVRAAAFARISQLRDTYGGRIPRAALSGGVGGGGQKIPIWNLQKGIFKPAAFGRDGAALSIQTSVDSPYADVQDATTGEIAYKYRGTDILKETDGPMLRYGLQAAEGIRLLLPHKSDLRPNAEFLAERFELFKAA